MTVEVDPVRVESRLAAGEIGYPRCGDGVLAGWGHARARWIDGLEDSLRPRRARRRSCRATHVLLPVTVLCAERMRRSGFGLRWWRAHGVGHRRIGVILGVPAATVRGWLRRAARGWRRCGRGFSVAVTAGVDVRIPDTSGCPWWDALAAVEAATAAITSRFGAAGLLGAVTPARVAAAASSGRLLAPGWPGLPDRGDATPVAPAVAHDDR